MSKPISYPSVLLMESHGLAPNVRATSFSSTKVWSKLYQSGPYFVDLMLRPGEGALDLHGELMASDDVAVPDMGTVTLRDRQGRVVSTGSAYNGTFNLELATTGSYQLDLTFGDEKLLLSGIEI